ncbi:hypothetical protein GVAV_000186 [Gurleya vavrai]
MIVNAIYLIFKYFFLIFIVRLLTELFFFIRSRIYNYIAQRKLKEGWILITGATDGIGKSLALELSKKKCKLFIVGRNQEKINEVQELIIANGAKCLTKKLDFSEKIDFTKLFSEYDIRILVNNAGCCSDGPQFFIEDDQNENIVNVNIVNTVKLTQEILINMRKKKTGYIINIGSLTGDFSTPFLSTYGASKSFIKAWSRSLNRELKNDGVYVECMVTGYVCTKMSKVKRTSFFCPSAETYAKCIIKHFGCNDVSYAYLPHLLQAVVVSVMPKFIFAKLVLMKMEHTKKILVMKSKK